MVAYAVFIREETTDQAELDIYASLVPAAGKGHAITRLALYGAHEVLEGPEIEGVVILEFPSVAEAKAWYGSPAYQAAAKHRHAGSRYRAFIVEGVN
ncbi:MAG TPA: DUF1330 domain-containing protein [Aliidongia sp.]|nr:DUF1330 domain-containing protein [Aliidongia sp.]